MTKFFSRSGLDELIDQPDIPFTDWEQCLGELDRINTLLGGHSITVEGVKKLIYPSLKNLSIAEIGCGGGDNLKAIHKWNAGKIDIHYTGIDLNKACTEYAAKNCLVLKNSCFIHSDYRNADFHANRPDVIFSSLFCHHFTDKEIVEMLVWLKKNSRLGFFINDLQRHPLAFYSIKWLTRIFSRSYLIKNDAPVSVLRGFKRQEWVDLMNQAGIVRYTIQWKWAFRYLIVVANEQ